MLDKTPKPSVASAKSKQFTIPGIDTIFNFHKPKPPLSEFVDSFWLYEGHETEQKPERILPTGTLELVINLRENELRFYEAERPENCSRYSGAVVSGAHGRGFTPEAETSIIGVHFKPGGAFPFLGLPAGELADTHVDLETLWGRSARVLREQLSNANTSAERAGAIVALVLGLIGLILSVVHLGTSTGGFGTGGGRAGAIVALVLSLIGMNLGGLALARARRAQSTN